MLMGSARSRCCFFISSKAAVAPLLHHPQHPSGKAAQVTTHWFSSPPSRLGGYPTCLTSGLQGCSCWVPGQHFQEHRHSRVKRILISPQVTGFLTGTRSPSSLSSQLSQAEGPPTGRPAPIRPSSAVHVRCIYKSWTKPFSSRSLTLTMSQL